MHTGRNIHPQATGESNFKITSPYMAVSDHGYTKHYYAGTERLAARIGGGFDRHVVGEDHGLSQQTTSLFEQCRKETARRVLEAPPPHTIRRDHLSENIYMAMTREFEAPMHLEANVVIKSNDLIRTAQNIVAGNAEPEVYFYHSDHLGSASWITAGDGKPVQHLQYLPYGEPYINQRVSGYNERFTFTGKERDEETGYSYFSARYLDHEILTSFLSVDRYADKYPFISPYAYCAWNPVRLTDPTGDTICINGQHYTPGMSGDGLDEFAKKTVAALNTIYGTNEGRSLIDKLGNSDNIFTIEEAEKSEFKPFDNKRASLVQLKTDPDCQSEYQRWLDYGLDLNGGSGGTISWNSAGSILPTEDGGLVCATTDLAHEMFHALDANQGLLDHREEKGIPRKDWQAVYRENILRGQMGLPLRTHYRKQMTSNGEFVGGRGERMTSEGKPIRPSWY